MEQITYLRERGTTLVEIMIVLAITAIILAVSVGGFSNEAYRRHAALSSFSSALDRAHGLAQTSGHGATIVKFLNSDAGIGYSGYFFLICAGRPIAGTPFGSCTQLPSSTGNIAALPPSSGTYSNEWALYLDTRGTVSLGVWIATYAQTLAGTPATVGSEPSCPSGASIELQFSGGQASENHTVDCSTGVYQ